MTSTRFNELTRSELAGIAPSATVVVPVGSTEQHGPHLPVQVDAAVITHVADRAVDLASAVIPVLRTPTLPFGIADHHLPFGGTISISMHTYLDVLTDIGRSLHNDGFRRIVFLNGHGGNASAVAQIADRLTHELRLDLHVAATSYWQCAIDLLADFDLDGAPKPGHAGSFETSLLLALHPELVQVDHMPPPEPALKPLVRQQNRAGTIRHPDLWLQSDGRTDDAHRASAEIGEKLLVGIAESVSRFLITFHEDSE